MKSSTIAVVIITLLVIFGAGYWWVMHPEIVPAIALPSSGTNAEDENAYVPGNLLLGTDATTTLGTYLIASNGMTLYTYAKDLEGVSNCIDLCAANWPPYTISSRDVLKNVQAGIEGRVDAITRADGVMQVT